MSSEIRVIFLDLGNTLRIALKDELHMAQARQQIVHLLGIDEDPDSFCEKLDERYKDYRDWAFETNMEAPEPDLWTRWLVPDFPPDMITAISEDLTYQYRQSNGRRVVVSDGRTVIEELKQRGYILGIISNLISTREIPEWLEEEGYKHYFSSVVLSSVYGIRKPDPAIFLEAANRAGIAPENCAYVGDNLNRDVTGARAAGFGKVVIVNTPQKLEEATITEKNKPDILINHFIGLLDIFK